MHCIRVTTVLILLVPFLAARHSPLVTAQDKADASYMKIEAKGKLKAGIVAIGSETTGFELETKTGTVELNFGRNRDMQAKASNLDGKTVAVTGTLVVRKGVEVKLRVIVNVTSVKEAE